MPAAPWIRAAAVVTVALPVALAVPAPARAAAQAWVSTVLSTSVTKTVTATCTGDQLALGAGGYVAGGRGGVALTSVVPSDDLRSVTVTARARLGHLDPWSLNAQAVCEGGAAAVLVRSAPLSATATCPDRHWLTGAGFQLARDDAAPALTGLVPAADLRSVTARALGSGPPAAYAICTAHQWGQIINPHLLTSARTVQQATVSANVPTPVYGVGGEIVGALPGDLIDGLKVSPGGASVHAQRPTAGTKFAALGPTGPTVVVYGVDAYFYGVY